MWWHTPQLTHRIQHRWITAGSAAHCRRLIRITPPQCRNWLEPAEAGMAPKPHCDHIYAQSCVCMWSKWPFVYSFVSLAIRRYVVVDRHISHTLKSPAGNKAPSFVPPPWEVWQQQKAKKVRGEWGTQTQRANGSSPSTTEWLKRNKMFSLGRPGSSSAIVRSSCWSRSINRYYSSETRFSLGSTTWASGKIINPGRIVC